MAWGSGLGDAFQRQPLKFYYKGINVARPVNFLEDGYYPFAKNIRSYVEGQITTRPGFTNISGGYLNIHSIHRLNDVPRNDYTYIVGADNAILFGKTVLVFSEAGFSGLPLMAVEGRPERSPSPLLYLTDGTRMRKFDVLGNGQQWGIFPPREQCSVTLSPALYNSITDCTSANPQATAENGNVWNKSVNASTLTQTNRTNTTINNIVYDSGAVGYCNIVPASQGTDIQPGQRILINSGGGTAEYVAVEQTFPQIKSTTIEGIVYEIGASGFCTIQLATPVTGLLVNTLVQLAATEIVRVLSVTDGPDGKPCFRCSTTGTFTAGQAVTGFRNFRCYTVSNHIAAETLITKAYESIITPAGIGNIRHNIARDLSAAGSRPITDDDEICVGVYLSDITKLIEGRIFFDVDPNTTTTYAATDLSRNYYFYPFRTADLQRYAVSTNTTTQLQASFQNVQSSQLDRFNERSSRQQIEQFQPRGILPTRVRQQILNRLAEQDGNTGQGGGLFTAPVRDSGEFQVGSGQEQWYQLRIKVGDLIRVGTDQSRSLKDCTSFMINFNVSDTTTIRFSSVWIGGTYGPDAEIDYDVLGNAYYYRTVGRNSSTGEMGLPSPPTRAGVVGRRQQRTITCPLHPDPQVDKLDIYRYGGTLLQWIYLATVDNTGSPSFVDNLTDGSIANNPLLTFDRFPPVPTAGIPRSGTCNVVGTRVTITGGSAFTTNDSPGNEIIINGKAYLTYAMPESTTVTELTQSAGTATGAVWEMPNPIVMGQPLPTVFGPYGQGQFGLFYFFLGDSLNPGVLYWSNGNDPNSCSDLNYLEVASPSQPLIGGCIYDGRPYVWTTEKMYLISQNFSAQPGQPQFISQEVANGKGAWTRRGITVDTLIYFIGKDGIYESEGGQPRSITDDTLFPLFPHDGQEGTPTSLAGGLPSPAYTKPNSMMLDSDGQYLRFVYQDSSNQWNMLVWDKAKRRWYYDVYSDGGVRVVYSDKGPTRYKILFGTVGFTGFGSFVSYGGAMDNLDPIQARILTLAFDANDPRSQKRFGDQMFDLATGTVAANVNIYKDNYTNLVVANSVFSIGRGIQIIDLVEGDELFAVNIGIDIIHPGTNGARLELYEWQPSWIPKPELTFLRATDWELSGDMGAKFLQGVIIEADTEGVQREIRLESGDQGVIQSLFINHDGQSVKSYALETPVIGSSFRLRPVDDFVDWRIFNVTFVHEPAPELVKVWKTQATTHDVCGWQILREAYITVASTAEVVYNILCDGAISTYFIPQSGGEMRKYYLPLRALKGKIFEHQLTSVEGFRLFQKDSCVISAPWGRTSEMIAVKPFGGDSRRIGATI